MNTSDFVMKSVPEINNYIFALREVGGDIETVDDVIAGYHLPPEGYEINDGLILDLGSHVGLTIADLYNRYQDAFIIGVELDLGNYKFAEFNIMSNDIPAVVVNAGITAASGDIFYSKNEHGNNAHLITDSGISASGITIDDLISRKEAIGQLKTYAPLEVYGEISYIKMDIEGQELPVLEAGGDWVDFTRCIGVEIHEPHTKEQIAKALENLGFEVEEKIGRAHV